MAFMLCQECDREKWVESENWLYELKYDGERAFIYVKDFKVAKIVNRRGYEILKQFPEFKNITFNSKSAIIDSEIIVENGKMGGDFNNGLAFRSHLQNEREIKERSERLRAKIMAFDIIDKEGENLKFMPLIKRKEILRQTFTDSDLIKCVEYWADFKQIWGLVERYKLEGVIAKHISTAYEDIRSKYWVKIKNWKEEIVEFDSYEIVDSSEGYYKGIKLLNREGLKCSCLGRQSEEVRRELEQKGKVRVVCQYLERTEKNNRLRFITFKEMIKGV